jgi:hypothetical protein
MTSIFKVLADNGQSPMNSKIVNRVLTLWLLTGCKLLTVSARGYLVKCKLKNKVEVIINQNFSLFALSKLKF